MTPEHLVSYATIVASVILSAAFLMTVYRVIIGPTLPDRVIAMDMLVGIAIGFIAVIAIRSSFNLYIDIAIALALVGFLATVAFARFILSRLSDGSHKIGGEFDGSEDGKPPQNAVKRSKNAMRPSNSSARKKRG